MSRETVSRPVGACVSGFGRGASRPLSALRRKPRLRGCASEAERDWLAPGSPSAEELLKPTMRFGEQLSLNPQLQPLLQREHFFLTKLIPRKLTWSTALPVAWSCYCAESLKPKEKSQVKAMPL
mgnify:CR=1 FL=1